MPGNTCSALRTDGDRRVCVNGFPTHPYCEHHPEDRPKEDGRYHYGGPFCLREEWAGKTFAATGRRPRHIDEKKMIAQE